MKSAASAETLVITVDVECDADGGRTWRNSDPLSFRGVSHGLGEVLAPILENTAARATLLVSNVVLEDDSSVGLLRELPGVELGTHLHGDFLGTKRVEAAGAMPCHNQNEYEEEVERAKLEELGELFTSAFGRAPTSFRAGRWSAGGRTTKLLAELGYAADSSVSPKVHWRDGGRSVDYRAAPDQPYRPSEADIGVPGSVPIWELPVSIAPRPWVPGRPAWLRPSVSSMTGMRHVVASIRRRHPPPRTYVAMLHNNELTPGTSPYSRTPAEARRVALRLRQLLAWASDSGMRFATLTEAAAALGGA